MIVAALGGNGKFDNTMPTRAHTVAAGGDSASCKITHPRLRELNAMLQIGVRAVWYPYHLLYPYPILMRFNFGEPWATGLGTLKLRKAPEPTRVRRFLQFVAF